MEHQFTFKVLRYIYSPIAVNKKSIVSLSDTMD